MNQSSWYHICGITTSCSYFKLLHSEILQYSFVDYICTHCTLHPVTTGPKYLDSRLGEVVRVPQFCSHVEPEVLRVLNSAVTQADADTATLFEGLLLQQRLQDWVQLLSNVLQEHLGASREVEDAGMQQPIPTAHFLHTLHPLIHA